MGRDTPSHPSTLPCFLFLLQCSTGFPRGAGSAELAAACWPASRPRAEPGAAPIPVIPATATRFLHAFPFPLTSPPSRPPSLPFLLHCLPCLSLCSFQTPFQPTGEEESRKLLLIVLLLRPCSQPPPCGHPPPHRPIPTPCSQGSACDGNGAFHQSENTVVSGSRAQGGAPPPGPATHLGWELTLPELWVGLFPHKHIPAPPSLGSVPLRLGCRDVSSVFSAGSRLKDLSHPLSRTYLTEQPPVATPTSGEEEALTDSLI